MDMHRRQQIGAVAILAAAAWLVYEALQLRYFTSLGPGPGFFPRWLALALAGLAVLMLAGSFVGRRDRSADEPEVDRAGIGRIVAIAGAVAGAALGLDWLGFAPTMFLVNLLVLLILGRRGAVGVIAIAAAGSFGVYYLFTRWLNVPLPAGPFSF